MRILERTIIIPSLDTELRLIPFGCVHADTDGFAASLWKECLEDIKRPHTYAIGAGDYLDAVRTHARNAINEYRARGGSTARRSINGSGTRGRASDKHRTMRVSP